MRKVAATIVFAALGMTSLSASAENIRIGMSAPYSGPAAVAAERERWGVDLAVEEINEAGGVLGRQLEIVDVDNRCNPSEAVNAANRLVSEEVVAIVGAHCSSATLATMPIIEEAGIPLVSGISSSPRITEQSGVGGNEWTFRINPSDLVMMQTLVRYIADNDLFQTVAIIAEDSDFGRGGVDSFTPLTEEAGLEILSTDIAPQNTPDYTPLLTRVSRANPDAIALFQLGGDQINFLRNAMQLGLTIPYTGRVELGGENREIIEAGGMEGSVSAWTYSPDIYHPANKTFAEKILEKHDLLPVLQTWSGYDSIRIIAQAIEEAGSAEPEAIRDALEAITFETVMGPKISFDDNHQGGRIVIVQSVENNDVVILDVVDVTQ